MCSASVGEPGNDHVGVGPRRTSAGGTVQGWPVLLHEVCSAAQAQRGVCCYPGKCAMQCCWFAVLNWMLYECTMAILNMTAVAESISFLE